MRYNYRIVQHLVNEQPVYKVHGVTYNKDTIIFISKKEVELYAFTLPTMEIELEMMYNALKLPIITFEDVGKIK